MTEYTFKFNDNDLQVIAAGLNEIVRKYSQPVLEKIQAQVDEQLPRAEQDLPKEP